MKLYLILLRAILSSTFEEIGSVLLKLFLWGYVSCYYGFVIVHSILKIAPLSIVSAEKHPLMASFWSLLGSADGYHLVGMLSALLYTLSSLFEGSLSPLLTNFHPVSKQKRYIISLIYEFWNLQTVLGLLVIGSIYFREHEQPNFNLGSFMVLIPWLLIAVFLKRSLLKLFKFKLSKQKIGFALLAFGLLPAAFYALFYFQILYLLAFALTTLFILIALDFILHDESLFLKSYATVWFEKPFLQMLFHNKKFLTLYFLSTLVMPFILFLEIFFLNGKLNNFFNIALFFASPVMIFSYWGANLWAFFPNYLFCLSISSDAETLMKTYFKIIAFSVGIHFVLMCMTLLSVNLLSFTQFVTFVIFYLSLTVIYSLIGLYGSVEYPKKFKKMLQMNGTVKTGLVYLIMFICCVLIFISYYPILLGICCLLIMGGAFFAIHNFERAFDKSKYKLFATIFKK